MLSSCIRLWILDAKLLVNPIDALNSLTRLTTGNWSLQAVLIAMYSASIVDNAISACSLDLHSNGHQNAVVSFNQFDYGRSAGPAYHRDCKVQLSWHQGNSRCLDQSNGFMIIYPYPLYL
jgi:hypothetical protein